MRRGDRVSIGFMVAWLVVWGAGMLIAIWSLGAAALQGEVGAILFLAIWLAGAAFGLVAGARKLRGLTFGEPRKPLPPPTAWHDGIAPGARPDQTDGAPR